MLENTAVRHAPRREVDERDNVVKVLLVLDHAPDYREDFLRLLSSYCDLTVLAQPCHVDNLAPPTERKGYKYIELAPRVFGPLRWLTTPGAVLDWQAFDVLCVAWNPRHPWRIVPLLRRPWLRRRWIWWGQVYGRSGNLVLRLVRRVLIRLSSGALVYSEDIAKRLAAELNSVPVMSFNNSSTLRRDFRACPWSDADRPRFLFVGRPQDRKRLDRALALARRYPEVLFRFVGPGMLDFLSQLMCPLPDNVEVFDRATGKELERHFECSQLVINPGHLGLLAVNAAQHRRGLAVQSDARHAPEVILAQQAGQIFMDFDDPQETSTLIATVQQQPERIRRLGLRIQEVALARYTVENMVEVHLAMFRAVAAEAGRCVSSFH